MNTLKIPAQEVRLPMQASAALAEGTPVEVTRYGRPIHVLLSQEQFALVAPLLELMQEGVRVSPELLMSKEDIALARELAEDREPSAAEERQIEALLADAAE